MSINNNPYTPHPITDWVVNEFARRSDLYNITFDSSGKNKVGNPKTPWVRVCSNGNGLNFLGTPNKQQTAKTIRSAHKST